MPWSRLASLFASRGVIDHAPPPVADWLISCVADNNPKYLGQAVRFVQSWRWFGGATALARVRVSVVEAVDPSARHQLEALGAEVRVVPRFLERNPFANKLQAFMDGDEEDAALHLLCDCDTLIVGDPRPFVRGDRFQAKIADLPTVRHATFKRVFRYFGVRLPTRRFVTDFQNTATIPYFNSGVVVLPRAVARRLVPTWRAVNRSLVARLDLLGAEALHVNQASLAVALAMLREPVWALDRAMNYPLHNTHLEPAPGFADCDPVIVHYHDRVDERGRIVEPPYPAAATRVAAFNRRWTAAERVVKRSPSELLLTGISRSGTSWLCNLLHRFEDCVVLNEPQEVIDVLQRDGAAGIPAFFADTRRRVLAGEPILNKLSAGELTADTAVNDERSFYQPRPASDGFVLAVKNTRAFLSRLEAVADAMPAARIVACVRNPLDTIGSWKRSFPHLRDADLNGVPVGHPEDPWLSEEDRTALRAIAALDDVAVRRANWWLWFAERLLRHRARLALVRYHDLVVDPGPTLREALDGYQLGELSQPLTVSSPRTSRAELDAHDVEVIRAICMDAALELGVAEAD